jgi:glutamate synthase (NADPH/NADH) large chain
MTTKMGYPELQGLYHPSYEKDGCGIGLVTDILGRKSHQIVLDAITILENLSHRGAQGADSQSGDGCGILTQIPDQLLRREFQKQVIDLPPVGDYAVAMIFFPPTVAAFEFLNALIEKTFAKENLKILGSREIPVVSAVLGKDALKTEPKIRQVVVERGELDPDSFERKLYVVRRLVELAVDQLSEAELAHEPKTFFAIPSFSSTTLVYKGLLLPEQLKSYFLDLADSEFVSAIAMVHSRFSTNTFPSWKLAHPYRYLCHNGEINTLKGNLNWMRAREGQLDSELLGDDLKRVLPIIGEHQSDSACLDNMVEFLIRGGRSLPHAMMMLIPEPWGGNPAMSLERRGFYEYHASMMEAWDGPAAVCFTDGNVVGATLDRNGLRPCRYLVTNDDRFILASEAGVLELDPALIRKKGRLEPGKMLLVDTVQGRMIEDEEVKNLIMSKKPYRSWVSQHRISLDELPMPIHVPKIASKNLIENQRIFALTEEELKRVIEPMAVMGEEPLSSMGMDTPLAVLSERPQLLFQYFKQLFAQVTNPPIDPIRENLVMSLVTHIGPRANLMTERPDACRRIKVQQPILTNADLQKIREMVDPNFRSDTLTMLFSRSAGAEGLESKLQELCEQAVTLTRQGCKFLILSDRGANAELVPLPSLLVVSAIHQRLIQECLRTEVGLLLETGEARDVHQFACLIGFGAGSVNPYLTFDTLSDLAKKGYFPEGIDEATAHSKFIKAVSKGLLKIFSKMGISTLQSYCGAQLFEAVGIAEEVVQHYFKGTASARIGGMNLLQMGEECLRRHENAFREAPGHSGLEVGGEYHYRRGDEHHDWNPDTIAQLQRATRENDASTYAEFSKKMNGEVAALRSLFELVPAVKPIPVTEVESAAEIVKRFTTGAMSLGAISKEAHETLAIAMNRIGAKSNTGEGGEDESRFQTNATGDSANSYIKQVASARFGVTIHYLANAREIQIKMAQGAKPGEGGQLPGHKVDEQIARLRFSTPGVQLISPPPHHDIYSIEDLKQLIFDLRNANPDAVISVKLVAEAGVGVVAAGVAKAHADKILISGDSGGTGASPLSSIRYAGVPWELGLAEAHQTLVLNQLRGQVRLETDGQLRTGRDVAVAALLGAEEFGFATAPLIVEGCIMMRKCHLNTCPVGIATQDPELRAKFQGKPEHVINYFFFVAEELRAIMASLGFKTMNEMIGQTAHLRVKKLDQHWKASKLDLSPLLHRPKISEHSEFKFQFRANGATHALESILDEKLVSLCTPAIENQKNVSLQLPIRNVNRTVGAYLSGKIAKKYGAAGLPDGTIQIHFTGSAGQSFGAFLTRGIEFLLTGESNDYLGKSLSGGTIVVAHPKTGAFDQMNSILIGNTSLYGATSGEAYIAGRAGERFAVRNSGAQAVVEGVGDHGCEYMTGGTVVILGTTGRNFGAGMSGGVAYVYDHDGSLVSRCNLGMMELEEVVSPEDEADLKSRIEMHYQKTDSHHAMQLLYHWSATVKKFKKVMPIEYRLILEQRKKNAALKISAAALAEKSTSAPVVASENSIKIAVNTEEKLTKELARG